MITSYTTGSPECAAALADPEQKHVWIDGKLTHIYTGADLPAPVVPAEVTMRQARLALLQAGKLAAVNAAVAAMPGAAGDTARIEWEFSSTVERHRPLVEALGASLGMTADQLDDLFRTAATL